MRRFCLNGNISSAFEVTNVAHLGNSETTNDGVLESGAAFIPNVNHADLAQAALAEAPNDTNINWPAMGMASVNEFAHEVYIVQAFPVLFPKWLAHYLSPGR